MKTFDIHFGNSTDQGDHMGGWQSLFQDEFMGPEFYRVTVLVDDLEFFVCKQVEKRIFFRAILAIYAFVYQFSGH
jgi:hypothetical protein